MQRPLSAGTDSFSQGCRIRRATPSDANAVSALLRRAFQEFRPLYTPEAFTATVQPERGILTRMEEGPLWVGEGELGVVGTVSAVGAGGSVMIRGMAVDPDARGQEIGKAIGSNPRVCPREGLRPPGPVHGGISSRAIRLYQSAGFGFTGEKSSPYGTELLRMVKDLK
jgi:ribosomal protein S18 acetylase RimI-like enzyme